MSNTKDTKNEVPFFKKIVNKFRYGLVLFTIRNRLTRIGIKITPYYWVQEGAVPTEEPEIRGQISDFSVGFIEAEEIKAIAKDIHAYPVEILLEYLDSGNKCLALKYKDEITSIMFINLKICDFTLPGLPLKEDEAYLTFMYTMDSFRGKNLAPYLRYKSYEILKNMGRTRIYSVSVIFNSSAVRYKEKLNARNLKLKMYIELFKKFKWRFTLRNYRSVLSS